MKSAGNDIVALKTINVQRSNDIQFYSKIITRSEQLLYHQSTLSVVAFENYVWLLWSVKESVYKYLQRKNPGLLFSPINIAVQNIAIPSYPLIPQFSNNEWEADLNDEGFYQGKIIAADHVLYYRSIIHPEFIHTIVDEDETFKNVYYGIELIDNPSYDNQSHSVRACILNKLQVVFPDHDVQISKSETGYPTVIIDEKETDIPLSIAHHHLFTAYSFKI